MSTDTETQVPDGATEAPELTTEQRRDQIAEELQALALENYDKASKLQREYVSIDNFMSIFSRGFKLMDELDKLEEKENAEAIDRIIAEYTEVLRPFAEKYAKAIHDRMGRHVKWFRVDLEPTSEGLVFQNFKEKSKELPAPKDDTEQPPEDAAENS